MVIFAPKLGQKCLKMGLKCLGLVWYGVAWPCWVKTSSSQQKKKFQLTNLGVSNSSLTTKNQTFNFAILDNLKNTTVTKYHNLAKPNHTKPNQDILGPFLSIFDSILGQKWPYLLISPGFDLDFNCSKN